MGGLLFVSQAMLDSWAEQGKIDFVGNVMTLLAGEGQGRSYALEPAVRFLKLLGEDDDPHGLVHKVKSVAQLREMGAEPVDDSCILGDVAYEVQPGFLAEAAALQAAATARPRAPGPAPRQPPSGRRSRRRAAGGPSARPPARRDAAPEGARGAAEGSRGPRPFPPGEPLLSIAILRLAAAALRGRRRGATSSTSPARATRALATVGFWLLAVAFVVHAVAIGVGCSEFGGAEFFSLRGGLVLIVVARRRRVPAPAALLPAARRSARSSRRSCSWCCSPPLFGDPAHPEMLPETLRHPHAHHPHRDGDARRRALRHRLRGSAVMYLLQEREVKGKRFGALFSRLPSLDALDRMDQRLVRAGFVVYTVALLAGTITADGGLEERLVLGPAADRLARRLDPLRRRWCSSATTAGTAAATRSSPSSASCSSSARW